MDNLNVLLFVCLWWEVVGHVRRLICVTAILLFLVEIVVNLV